MAILRLAISLSNSGQPGLEARDAFLAERTRQLQAMLDRARDRGEQPPDVLQVLDLILSPMYIRILFGTGPLTSAYTDELVDRLLCLHTAAGGV